MEFCKDRVFTALNADELKAGDKVIAADTMKGIREGVENPAKAIVEVTDIAPDTYEDRFIVNGDESYTLAYLVERKENCTNCGRTCSVPKEDKTARCWAYKTNTNRQENCTNCIYEGNAGCSIVEICGENKSTHRCHMYKAKDTKRNLCNSCKHSFAECSATDNDIVFGDGVGNDNVCECGKYEKHYRPFRDTDELIKTWIAKRMITYPDLCNPNIWVQIKGTNIQEPITGFDKGCMQRVKIDGVWISTQDLFNTYTFLDGTPCGVEE